MFWQFLLPLAAVFLTLPATAQITDQSFSSKGTAFWCAFLENLDLSMNDAPNFAFQIEAPRDVSGVITLVATGLTVPFNVSAGKVANVDMPQAVYYPMGSESVSNFGFLITADDTIQVKAIHWRTFFSETSAVLPLESLGSHYLAHCYRFQNNDVSSLIVVATKDKTLVTITPSAVTLQGRPAGLPYNVQLNKGETYQIQSFQDLVGTEIVSDEKTPIAVFGGAKQSQVECNSANSHLYDQCLPLDKEYFWGNRFFAVPFYGQGSSVLRILAAEDDTEVMLDCDSVTTLQRGQVWTHIFSTASVIYADKPVSAAQMSRGVTCSGSWQNGDPMILGLLPEGVYTQHAAARVPKRSNTGLAFSSNSLTIMTKAGTSNNIRLNGVPISNYPHTPLGQFWEFTKVAVKPDSTYHLDADQTSFQAYQHGFDYANAYSNWVGFDRLVLDTSLAGVQLLAPDTVCVDSTFMVTVEGGEVDWLELHFQGKRERIEAGETLQLSPGGLAVFTAAVQTPGLCQPQFISAQTALLACPPPPDTCPIQVPNAFTPNGDQANDLFRPVRAECSFVDYHFRVYNRWGQLVFETRQPFEGWNGDMPDGQVAPSDVYVWRLTYRRYAGADLINQTNEVTLLR